MLQHEMVPKPSTLNNEAGHLSVDFIVNSDSNCCDDARLKKELRIAADHCQLLAEKLCRNDRPPSRKAVMSNSLDGSSSSERECCREQRMKIRAIVAENIKLRQDLKDVTEINKRWQRYNTQQQEYIHRMQSTIEVIQTGNDPPCVEVGHVPFRQEVVKNEFSLMDHTQTLSLLKRSYEKAVKENCRLENLVEELRRSLETKKQENTEELTRDLELHNAKEQVDFLRLQLMSHKEDWENEKVEKENAKRQLQRAIEDIKEITTKCQLYESRLHRIQVATLATLDGIEKTESEPWEVHCGPMENVFGAPQLRVLSRGSGRRNAEFLVKQNSLESDVELDCTSPPPSLRSPASASSLPERTSPITEQLTYHVLSHQPSNFERLKDSAKDVVSCPSCRKQFSADHHVQFLDHFEECQKDKRTANDCLVSVNCL